MQEPPTVQPPAPTAPIIRIDEGPGREAQTLAIPMTRAEVSAIRARRSELSTQLTSASRRRRDLAEQLRNADDAARPGLQQRIAVLDERIVQLESDIAQTGRQLTGFEAGLLSSTDDAPIFGGFSSGEALAGGIVFTIFVLMPLAVGLARMMWKYAAAPPVRPALPPETAGRLERIEQAVESIAIEVERVSEGQRFVTKLMAEARPVAALENTRMLPQTHGGRES